IPHPGRVHHGETRVNPHSVRVHPCPGRAAAPQARSRASLTRYGAAAQARDPGWFQNRVPARGALTACCTACGIRAACVFQVTISRPRRATLLAAEAPVGGMVMAKRARLLGSLTAFVMVAGTVEAADLGSAPTVPMAPLLYSWSGCYIGGFIGGAWAKDPVF